MPESGESSEVAIDREVFLSRRAAEDFLARA